MPPFAYLISGSVIALITLRKGVVIGLQTLIVSLLVLLVFSEAVGLPLHLSVAYASVICLPVWFSSSALRLRGRQGLLLLAAGLLAVSLIIVAYMTIDDVSGWWQQWLNIMLEKAVPPERIDQYKDVLEPAAAMVNAMRVAGLMLNILMSVLCARWWQSRLFNPGAFQKEFYAFRLPPAILPVSAMNVLLAFTLGGPWQGVFRDITVILMFMYLIQGISSVHRYVDKLKLSTAWIVTMYCLLVLMPQMGLFIACLGVMDVYIDWRRKEPGSKNES